MNGTMGLRIKRNVNTDDIIRTLERDLEAEGLPTDIGDRDQSEIENWLIRVGEESKFYLGGGEITLVQDELADLGLRSNNQDPVFNVTPTDVLEMRETTIEEGALIERLDFAKRTAVADISNAVYDNVLARLERNDRRVFAALEEDNDGAYNALWAQVKKELLSGFNADEFGRTISGLFDVKIDMYGLESTVYDHAFEDAALKLKKDYSDPDSIAADLALRIEDKSNKRNELRKKAIEGRELAEDRMYRLHGDAETKKGMLERRLAKGKEAAPLYVPLEGRQYGKSDAVMVNLGKTLEADPIFNNLNQSLLKQGYDRVSVLFQPSWGYNPAQTATFTIQYQNAGADTKNVFGSIMSGIVVSSFEYKPAK